MSPKKKSPRFAVRGYETKIKQGNSTSHEDYTQHENSEITLRQSIKWQIVRIGSYGILPRPFFKFVLNILGLKHE